MFAHSRLSRTKRSCSTFEKSIRETSVSFCGWMSTRPSRCRRMNASLTGVLLTLSFCAISCVLIVVPGLRTSVIMLFLSALYTALCTLESFFLMLTCYHCKKVMSRKRKRACPAVLMCRTEKSISFFIFCGIFFLTADMLYTNMSACQQGGVFYEKNGFIFYRCRDSVRRSLFFMHEEGFRREDSRHVRGD